MAQKSNKIFIIAALFLFFQSALNSFAQEETFPFQGKISGNNINIRSDSTVSSETICTLDRGEPIEVVSALYEWYKIKLPKSAPSFIKKELVEPIDERTARVSGDIVNIRLRPDDASPILGKVKENEIVNILGGKGAWLRVEPVDNSFGWINKKFVKKTIKKDILRVPAAEGRPGGHGLASDSQTHEIITIEGIIKPKVITGLASHKLVTADKSVFLLKGNKTSLNSLNSRKAKVIGKIIPSDSAAPLVEIIKMEALD